MIMALSFYLATRSSLFYENLTYVGNMNEHRLLFLIWGISQSLYYAFLYMQIIQKKEIKNTVMNIAVACASILNIISFLLPYQNHSGDLLSQIHVYTSIGSSVLTCIILLWLLQSMQTINFNTFLIVRNHFMVLVSIVVFMAFLFGDFTSIMELFFTNGISYLLLCFLYH